MALRLEAVPCCEHPVAQAPQHRIREREDARADPWVHVALANCAEANPSII